MLADGLTAASGPLWQQLRDADGKPVAAELERKITRLYGLASLVYREVGFPFPLSGDEKLLDLPAAETAASELLAAIDSDPEVERDARLLVTLAADGMGSIRCPAVLGVRLEPVEYKWSDEPTVSSNIDPTFVAARYWLASPIPATVTVTSIPTPEEFRKQCDAHGEVASLCRAFGEAPPRLHTPGSRWWLGALAGLCLLGCAYGVFRWWRQRNRRTRWSIIGGTALAGAGLLAVVWFYPPLWLLRWGIGRLSTAPKGISGLADYWLTTWDSPRKRDLSLSLLRDSDAQMRYYGAMLDLSGDGRPPKDGSFTPDELTFLRSRVNDEVHEVGWAVWDLLATHPEELPFLIDELARSTTSGNAWYRLHSLGQEYPDHPEVIAAALKLASHADPGIREKTIVAFGSWKKPVAAFTDVVRAATRDPSALVRAAAAWRLGDHGTAADVPRLLEMWQDDAEDVRLYAYAAIKRRIEKADIKNPAVSRLTWVDPDVQSAVVRFVENPRATFKERFGASRWLADPAKLRATCRRLLPEADALPENPGSNMGRTHVLATLTARWLLADHPIDSRRERTLELDRRPELLARLTRSIEENPDPAATLALLRETAATQGPDRLLAKDLLESIEVKPDD
jgi:hypothetical protein